jgi:hypothetical protein
MGTMARYTAGPFGCVPGDRGSGPAAPSRGCRGPAQQRRPGAVEALPGGAVPGQSRPGPAAPSRGGRGPGRPAQRLLFYLARQFQMQMLSTLSFPRLESIVPCVSYCAAAVSPSCPCQESRQSIKSTGNEHGTRLCAHTYTSTEEKLELLIGT